MPEDAPVNTGAALVWPEPDAAYQAVRGMQTKLRRWAGGDASRRFDDLFNLVYDPAFLVDAWERVAGNKGAKTAGVDGATVSYIETKVLAACYRRLCGSPAHPPLRCSTQRDGRPCSSGSPHRAPCASASPGHVASGSAPPPEHGA